MDSFVKDLNAKVRQTPMSKLYLESDDVN